MNKCLKNNTFPLLVLSQKSYFNPPNLYFDKENIILYVPKVSTLLMRYTKKGDPI